MKSFKYLFTNVFVAFALLVSSNVSAKTTYFVNDHLGSVVAALDEQGEVLYREGYYPFGERMIKEDNEHSQWFTGKRHDEELGLSYYGARWYDPVVGRFTGIDAVEAVPDIISSVNRYAYSHNNPYKYIDSDGNFAFLIPLAVFIAKEVASEVVEQTTGVSMPTIKNGVKYASKTFGKTVTKGKPCCFVAGTEVLTKSGYVAIEKVQLGDLVWAKNTDTDVSDWKPVTKLFTEPDRKIYELVFEDTDGDSVKVEVSDNHPFRVGDKWIEVKDLSVGQLVGTKKAGLLKLKSWNETNRFELTYNFTVDEFHTYYVTQFDVLVHNCNKTYQTYTKTNPETGEVYTGRTSGVNSPEKNIANRDRSHHMNEKGFGPAVIDKSSSNYDAIRGREQLLIDANGKAKSVGGTSGNAINGISPKNPKKGRYEKAAQKEFGK